MLQSIHSILTPIHREGYRFVAIFFVVALLFFITGFEALGWVALVLTLWCAYFFRDPERATPVRDGLVISPADGRISAIEGVTPPPELDLGEGRRQRISVFMNVFDVHVNRAPIDGRITRIAYVPGKFINADLDKASEDNERQAFTIETDTGRRIGVVQIAGLLARRIVKFVEQGSEVTAGQRIGLIRFGSRVDIYLPEGHMPFVAVGQRSIAGETVLADLAAAEGARACRRS
ncbi:MAG: phosphatidylserine decarboxylase [Aestuariivirgaceae bacterium]